MTYQPPRARTGEKYEAIVEASRAHFLADGFAGTRMEPIARSAKVSTATVYAYFPGKEDLFEAMVAATIDDLKPRFSPGVAEVPCTPAALVNAATGPSLMSAWAVKGIDSSPVFATPLAKPFGVLTLNSSPA